MQLLQRNPDASPREEAVRMQVKLFIQSLSKLLAAKPKKSHPDSGSEEQNVAKLFEEVKAMVRELPERVDDKVRSASRRVAGRSLRRLHPKMLEEFLFRPTSSDQNQMVASLLMVLSLTKDDVPWIHEAGMAIYRAMALDDRSAVNAAHKQFQITMEMMMHGPWRREFFRDEEESFMMACYLPEMIERVVGEYLATSPIRRRQVKVTESATPERA
jgi:hypothetical protein